MTPKPAFDADWKQRALEGDAAATELLVDAALQPLFRFCLYRVGKNRHLCEEVVQETLMRAIGELARYDPSRSGDAIFPWLQGLARNEIRRALARQRTGSSWQTTWDRIDEDLRELFTQLDKQPFPDQALQRQETRDMVNAAMSQLPAHYRETLEAKYVECRSVRDIAADSAATEKSVESLLSRARRAFRETFLARARNLDEDAIEY